MLEVKKTNFLLITFLCLFVVSVTGCEDKAEKRAKLFAQMEEAKKELNKCYYDNRNNLSKCNDKKDIKDKLKQELDKLNGVK